MTVNNVLPIVSIVLIFLLQDTFFALNYFLLARAKCYEHEFDRKAAWIHFLISVFCFIAISSAILIGLTISALRGLGFT